MCKCAAIGAPTAVRHWRKALVAFLVGAATPALSQPIGTAAAPSSGVDDEIVIIGIPEFLRDISPERSFGIDDVAGYGLSTVEDLIAEIGAELGDDDEPVLIVNGQRVESIDEIAGYPVEAIQRLDVLPRGTGTRVGASSNRRVYSVQLRRQVRSATVTVAPRLATDGDWFAWRAEAILTRIRDQRRINLTLRVRDEDALLESERDIIQPPPRFPFDLRGNVIADPRQAGDEIDPALSVLAGRRVTVAAVPQTSSPNLAAFAAAANAPNVTDLGAFRTLRPDVRAYDLNLSVADRLAPWLSASVNARLNHSERQSLLGLPTSLFILSPTNAASPFSVPVGIARYGGPDPLDQRSRTTTGNLNLSLNANFRTWRLSFNANHQVTENRSLTERQDPAQQFGFTLVPDARNPFAVGLDDLLPVVADRSVSRSRSSSALLTASGSPFTLPAGPVQTTVEARILFAELDARSRFLGVETVRRFDRSERALRGTLEVPLASRRNGVLPALGDLSANAEYSIIDFSRAGSFIQYGYGLTWLPREAIRLRASVTRTRRPGDLALLFDPIITTPGSRIFDPLRGETVDVIWITGGNPALLPQSDRSEQFSAILRPWQAINLQLNAEYTATRNRNLISSLPPASVPILLAFPDRFLRDANGVLTAVDVRPVNFARADEKRLRYGLSFNVPLGRAAAASRGAGGAPAPTIGETPESADGENAAATAPMALAGGPRPRLQVSANHNIVLENEILIRPGLAPVDLLEGGAIGLAGGIPRHQFDFSIGYSDRGLGARLLGIWRSASVLETRLGGAPDRLRFAPLGTLNLRLFAEGRRLWPAAQWLLGARLSLSVTNLTNERQRVTDSAGNVPLQFQPGYRDALGRTIELEIRKVF